MKESALLFSVIFKEFQCSSLIEKENKNDTIFLIIQHITFIIGSNYLKSAPRYKFWPGKKGRKHRIFGLAFKISERLFRVALVLNPNNSERKYTSRYLFV